MTLRPMDGVNLLHDEFGPLYRRSNQLVSPRASLRPAEQVVGNGHVVGHQNPSDNSDDTLTSFVGSHARSITLSSPCIRRCKCVNFGPMETTWEIVKNGAGQFEIFRNGELHSTVNGSHWSGSLHRTASLRAPMTMSAFNSIRQAELK